MAKIVEELQNSALDRKISVSDLLRRTKLVAVKLRLNEVETWVEHELNGYPEHTSLPEYRIIRGQPVARSQVHGYLPVGGSVEKISRANISQSIAEIEDNILQLEKGGRLLISYPDELNKILNEANRTNVIYSIRIDRGPIVAILDRVRTLILDWALNLERVGIMGNEFNFDENEKAKARTSGATINITNSSIGSFAGNLGFGNISGEIQVSEIDTKQVNHLLEQLQPQIDQLEIAGASRMQLKEAMDSLREVLSRSEPDQPALRGLLSNLRDTLTNASGNLVAAGAIELIRSMLGQ